MQIIFSLITPSGVKKAAIFKTPSKEEIKSKKDEITQKVKTTFKNNRFVKYVKKVTAKPAAEPTPVYTGPIPPLVLRVPGVHSFEDVRKNEEAAALYVVKIDETTDVVNGKMVTTIETKEDKGPPEPMANDLSAREGQFFSEKYDSVQRLIPFSEDWINGNGRFYNLVNSAGFRSLVKVGELARSKDNQGRPLIIVGTAMGPIVVYQRYPDGINTIVYDAPQEFHANKILESEDRLTIEELIVVLGDRPGTENEHKNIGKIIFAALNK